MGLEKDFSIVDLERDWLKAETTADEIRAKAEEIDTALEELNGYKARSEKKKVEILLNQSEELHARHKAAEQAAREAFDRLWQARTARQNGSGAGAMPHMVVNG